MTDQRVTLRVDADFSTLAPAAQGAARVVGAIGEAGAQAGRVGSDGITKVTTATTGATAAVTSLGGAAVRGVGSLQQLGAAGAKAGQDIGSGIQRAEGVLDRLYGQLRRGAGLLAAGLGVQQITGAADAYTNLSSKLSLVTRSEAELVRVRTSLFGISQDTRQSTEATSELYTRLARATAELGLSEQQRLIITAAVNKAAVVSGATATESANAIIQLSQALASGQFRGDEFRSVAEQLPIILEMLSASLGKSRGELYAMAEAGQLTSEVLVTALLSSASDVDAQFDQMSLTIGGATQQLVNSFREWIGAGADGIGISTAIAASISGLAAVFSPLATVVTFVAAAWATKYVVGLGSAALAARAKTLAAVELTAAELVQARAAEAAAVANVTQARSLDMLVGGAVRATAAETALAAAQARTAAATAASTAATAANVGILSRAGSFFGRLIGGPIAASVLLIGSLALGISGMAEAAAQSDARIEQLVDQMDEAGASARDLAQGLRDAAEAPPPLSQGIERFRANAELIAEVRRELAAAEQELSGLEVANQRNLLRFGLANPEFERTAAQVAELEAKLRSLTGETGSLADALVSRFAPAVDQAGAALGRLVSSQSLVGAFAAIRAGIVDVVGTVDRITGADAEMRQLVEQISAGSAKAEQDLKTVGRSATQLAQGLADLALQRAEDAGWTDRQVAALRTQTSAYVENVRAVERLKSAAGDAARAQRERDRAERESRRAVEESIRAEAARVAALEKTRARIGDLQAELAGPMARAEREYGAAVEETLQALFRGEATREQTIQLLDLQAQAHERAMRAAQAEQRELDERANIVDAVLGDLRAEVGLLELTAEQREYLTLLLRAQALAQAEYDAGRRASNQVSEEELRVLREQTEALQQKRAAADFDFTRALSDGIGTAFRTGSASAGFRQFIERFTAALSGGIESAVGAIAQGLDLASTVANAYRGSDGNSVGAGLRALNSQLAASGNVFAQALAAIDSLFQGKLFGTDYQLARQGFNVGVSASGVTGSQFTVEERQRSLFRGTARRTTTDALDAGTQDALRQFFDGVLDAMRLGAASLGTQVPTLIQGAFREVRDANGRVLEQFSTVLGVQYRETFERFQQRLAAENIIRLIDQVFRVPVAGSEGGGPGSPVVGGGTVPGPTPPRDGLIKSVESFTGEASQIAARWRADAVLLLEGARFLLAAATDIRSGVGLLRDEGGLTAITTLVEDLQAPGESLEETYGRVATATRLLDTATALMGVSIEGTRESVVRAAAGIADAAGGIDRAQALWSSYFETFYTDSERAALELAEAERKRNERLAAIGLDPLISVEQFREAFEREFPNLTAEQRVQWLEAGAAIGNANAAQRAYNETLSDSEAAARAAREAVADLLVNLVDFAADLDAEFTALERSGLNDFQRRMLEIDDGLQENVARLLGWRASMEAAGASAEELARVDALLGRAHLLAAQQAAAAINALRDAGRNLVAQLYGDAGAAAQELTDVGVGAFEAIGDAAQGVAEAQLRSLQGIREWLDAQLLGDLASLTPSQQFAEAQGQFNAAVAAAQAGDPQALGRVTQLADVLLRLGRDRFAAGAEYTALESSIRAALTGLLGLNPGAGSGTGGGAGGFAAPLGQAVNSFGQQAETNRIELAQQLTVIVRDLMSATGESLDGVAQSLGLNLSDLVTDLGVNLDSLSVATTETLAAIANSLGVELTDLARSVGADLGSLADEQSLLNDAVEAAIGRLPQDQRDRLQPLLDAVEEAARTGGPDKVRTAVAALEAETRRIGGAAALALAPYLAGIDPTDPLVSIDGVLRSGFADAVSLLGAIEVLVRNLVAPQPNYVIDPTDPDGVTSDPGGGKSVVLTVPPVVVPAAAAVVQGSGSADNSAVVRELREMRAEMTQLRAAVASTGAATVQATREASRDTSGAIQQQTRDLSRGGRNFVGA